MRKIASHPHLSLEQINKAIAVPSTSILHSDDGRAFRILAWNPSVKVGSPVRVSMDCLIEIEEPEKDES